MSIPPMWGVGSVQVFSLPVLRVLPDCPSKAYRIGCQRSIRGVPYENEKIYILALDSVLFLCVCNCRADGREKKS